MKAKGISSLEELIEDARGHEHVRNRVYREMKAIGFSYVTMDLGGYRTGSMNETL